MVVRLVDMTILIPSTVIPDWIADTFWGLGIDRYSIELHCLPGWLRMDWQTHNQTAQQHGTSPRMSFDGFDHDHPKMTIHPSYLRWMEEILHQLGTLRYLWNAASTGAIQYWDSTFMKWCRSSPQSTVCCSTCHHFFRKYSTLWQWEDSRPEYQSYSETLGKTY